MPDQTAPRIEGRRLYCRPFTPPDISEAYLSWLNDPAVNRYSRRRYSTSTREDAERFLRRLAPGEHVLGIHLRENGRHIGNIQYGPIDRLSGHAEIRILIGDKSVWGKGYGTEAIYIVTRHLFRVEKLHRVEANTCNPAFARCVEKLGWKTEGALRERFLMDGKHVDYLWLGLLQPEFKEMPGYEPR